MADKMVPIEGSVPKNKHKLLGPADPKQRIELTVMLRRKSHKGLPTTAEFLAGKRVFMSRRELGERFGANREDADAVQHWAIKQGLSVSDVDLARRQVHLVGTVEKVSKAFAVKMTMHEHGRTHTKFRCPDSNLHVPESLANIITGVFGLTDMPVVIRHPAHVAKKRAKPSSSDPQSQFPGSFYPNQVAQLYNFPSTTGNGQRVAILEFGGEFDQTVLADYFTNNIGLATPPTVNALYVLGTQMENDGATGEVYLDIEVVGAMAPKATIDVYFAPWSGNGYLNAIQQAVQNDDYAAISISYGLDEDATDSWTTLHVNVEEAFQDAITVGTPVFVSTGDQGSSCLRGELSDQSEITVYAKNAQASYPASSPFATAVGGTLLYAANGAITNEVVWNELGAALEGAFSNESGNQQSGKYYLGGATGGGVSAKNSLVPSYQSNAGITPKSVNSPSATGRGIPDVSGNAGASTGYLVSQGPGSQIPIAPVGGTSASAPMWAALMACVREALSTKFSGTVPRYFFNDFVYQNGTSGAFRDIVGGVQITYDPSSGEMTTGNFTPTGNNRSSQADGYYSQKGFDLCTGWGSPNGNALLNQLQTWLANQPPSS
jgi:kumamolisin